MYFYIINNNKMARSRTRSHSNRHHSKGAVRHHKKSKRKSKKKRKSKRKLNAWQLLVKKTYKEGKAGNKNYKFSKLKLVLRP